MSPLLWPLLLSALLLSLVAVLALLWPLRRQTAGQGASLRGLSARVYRERLDELNSDLMAERIDADAYAQLKLELDRGVLADSAAGATAVARPLRSVRPLALMLVLLVPLAALALYWVESDRELWLADAERQLKYGAVVDRVLQGQAPEADRAQPTLPDFVRVLQRRTQADPHDVDAWLTLGMALQQAREYGPAQMALARAAEISPEDDSIVLAYVQSTIITQQGVMSPQVRAKLAQVMRRQPEHQGALLLYAMASLRGEERMAARDALLRLQDLRVQEGVLPQEDDQIARLLAQTEATPVAQMTDAGYAVEVVIVPELARQLPQDAVLFVFARPLQGGGMPIAVARRSTAQFPVRLTLDDAASLSPERLLSGEEMVVIQARISASGDATPQSGDLEAVAVPVRRGSDGVVRLRISERRP